MGIVVNRYSQSINTEYDFQIYINRQFVVSIRDGESIAIDMSPGKHEIYLIVDDFLTPVVEFDLLNEELTFTCGSKMPDKAGIRSPFSIRRLSHYAYIELDD